MQEMLLWEHLCQMLTFRLPVSLLVQEYLQLKLHTGCTAATKENLLCCELASMGKMDAILHVLGLCSKGGFFGNKDKRTYVKLLPERIEKPLRCLD